MINKIKHLLVIRSSAMGDVAMAVHPVLALVKAYPDLKITILTTSFLGSFFQDIPNVAVLPLDKKGKHKGILGLNKLAQEVKTIGVDAVADFHAVLRTNILKNLLRFSGIPFLQIDKGRAEKKALTRETNKVFKQLKSSHQRYVDVLNKLGFKIELRPDDVLSKSKLPVVIQEIIGQDTKKWIGIAPFAQHKGKVYSFEKMLNVIEYLSTTGNFKIFLFGGGQVEKEKLSNAADSFKNVINIAGRFKFSEELALISNLDIMLSMDSGNGHLAALYGIPVITLWGVTHPYAGFAPFGQSLENSLTPDLEKYPLIPTSIYGNMYPKGYEAAASSISKDVIIAKISSLLN